MEKTFILIGNRNTGISTIEKSERDKKINECLECKKTTNRIIVCKKCSIMFKDIEKLDL